jgi:hypothetical protein|tara:strand:+ start:1409 stop:1705 length:297 start_codon:yes stop_codon:yes gene_type:complete
MKESIMKEQLHFEFVDDKPRVGGRISFDDIDDKKLSDFEKYLKDRMYDAEYKLHVLEGAVTRIGLDYAKYSDTGDDACLENIPNTIEDYFNHWSRIGK